MEIRLDEVQNDVESTSQIMDKVVNGIIGKYCEDLDNYVYYIKGCLRGGSREISNKELEEFCLVLPSYIYFASDNGEYMGIREDISKALYKEKYNKERDSISGTIADKNAYAELQSREEQLISICYTRASKLMRGKVDNAMELLGGIKKVLSHRMQEAELSRIDVNNK